jgi:hypothetical protein
VFARVWDRAGNPSEVASATFKVVFVPKQATKLYSPRFSKSRLRRGTRVRIKSRVRPSAASAEAQSVLYLYRVKSKVVYKKIGGRWRRVKVWYWARTGKFYMARWRNGWVAATVRLRYRGYWKTYVVYPGSTGYEPCVSHVKRFRVR